MKNKNKHDELINITNDEERFINALCAGIVNDSRGRLTAPPDDTTIQEIFQTRMATVKKYKNPDDLAKVFQSESQEEIAKRLLYNLFVEHLELED